MMIIKSKSDFSHASVIGNFSDHKFSDPDGEEVATTIRPTGHTQRSTIEEGVQGEYSRATYGASDTNSSVISHLFSNHPLLIDP